MRRGHKSCCPQQYFDFSSYWFLMFMLIEQGKLIKEDRSQGEQLTAVQALEGHLATPFEHDFFT
jgi:hypothetical protein